MLHILIIIMIAIVCLGVTLDSSSSNYTYYGTPGIVREGMSTLRPQTTYTKGGCYPYNIATHPPTGGGQTATIFKYWSNKALTDEMQKTHLEWMKSRVHPKPHDVCYN